MNNFPDYCGVFRRKANAFALINGREDFPDIYGRVLFYQIHSGVIVRAEVTGLPKGEKLCDSPIFAFHIHEGKECKGDNFSKTMGHYNPDDCSHPYHRGDLPPLFGVNGKAFSVFLTNRFKVSDIIGKTIIIHSNPDDFTTQPSGNAGEKIACGEITSTFQ